MLKITNLKKEYGSFSLCCSLEVKRGCITGLIGQNGAGKSTTFKAVLGLITADGGSVTILGKEVGALTPKDKQKLGVVLPDSGFSGYLTINDLIPIMKALYDDFDSKFFLDKVHRFSLPVDKQIKAFSSGMKARLKVLIAISHNADLLILDEPTAGMDVISRDEMLQMLREYMAQDEGRTIIISSHISSDLEGLCDDIYMINSGSIVLHEDTDLLLSDYALLKADEAQYDKLDKRYIQYVNKESYGWCCLTNQKQYYAENYPQLAIENGSIDGVFTIIARGERL